MLPRAQTTIQPIAMSASSILPSTTAAGAGTGAEDATGSFQPSDFSFLNQVLHILEKVESGDDPQEIATLAGNLKSSFQKCQMILDHLPGADISPDEQARILAEETAVLARKKEQLQAYLSWDVFQHTTPAADPAPGNHTNIPQGPTPDTPDVKIEDASGAAHGFTATIPSSSFEPPSLDYSNTTLSTDGMLSQMSEVPSAASRLTRADDKGTGLSQQTANVILEDEDEINIV